MWGTLLHCIPFVEKCLITPLLGLEYPSAAFAGYTVITEALLTLIEGLPQ